MLDYVHHASPEKARVTLSSGEQEYGSKSKDSVR